MKIGFVVQRFGPGVEGGAEKHCLEVARRLAEHHDVQILTSTALHMARWHEAHFSAGEETWEGLSVRRFDVVDNRGPGGVWYRMLRKRLGPQRALSEQQAWLEAQGPVCPDLITWLDDHRSDYDAVVFFTYLYHCTAVGLLHAADRAVLVPTAHDEPPLALDVFRPTFLAPRAILYNTEEERELVQGRFANAHVPSWIAGVGIDAPPADSVPPAEGTGPHDLVYLGRVDEHKLFDLVPFFERYALAHPTARLILVGKPYMTLPEHPRILSTGFVSETEKWRWLRHARAFVMPSEFESLSMVLLEAWSVSTPALVNGRCAVLAGHIQRSGGGFCYSDYSEFKTGLDALFSDDADSTMGEAGRQYVAERYRWDAVLANITAAIEHAATR